MSCAGCPRKCMLALLVSLLCFTTCNKCMISIVCVFIIEFIINMIVVWMVALVSSFQTKNTLSSAHLRSVKQRDRTAHDV